MKEVHKQLKVNYENISNEGVSLFDMSIGYKL